MADSEDLTRLALSGLFRITSLKKAYWQKIAAERIWTLIRRPGRLPAAGIHAGYSSCLSVAGSRSSP